MAKHTPGPWKAVRRKRYADLPYNASLGFDIVGPDGKHYVAGSDGGAARIASSCGEAYRPAAEVEANMRLIEEAPALLELLIEALPYIETAESDQAYKPGVVRQLSNRIHAAIGRVETSR